MTLSQLTSEEALASLGTGLGGLSPAEALRRIREFGPNHLEELKRESLWMSFARQFTHFFAIILWIAAALAFFSEFKSPGQGMLTLGWAITAVIIINGIFSFWQEYRAGRAIAALRELLPPHVHVLRDGETLELPVTDLVPGDVIRLSGGDSVPADCRVIQTLAALRVNNATLTGESAPRTLDSHADPRGELARAKNLAFAGTVVLSGQALALVYATGMRTEFGKIARLTQHAEETESPLQKEIARLSRIVAVFSTLLGALFFSMGHTLGFSFWQTFIFAIGVIVANVPEGLLPTVTLSLAMAAQRMAQRNALIRHLPKVETLGSATVICTDKTGTLTQNKMTVTDVFLNGEGLSSAKITGDTVNSNRAFFEGAALCQSLTEIVRNGTKQLTGDPMESALVAFSSRFVELSIPRERVGEIPFDAERKRYSVLYRAPGGPLLYCKGALEVILPLCKDLDQATRARALEEQNRLADQGLRVLAFAHRRVPGGLDPSEWEKELSFDGLAGLEDPPRPEVAGAIERCRRAGIQVIMVTGDHPHTARSIARQIGLTSETPKTITGPELEHFTDAQLQLALSTREILFARTGADQKMRIVRALKQKGHIVAATGDGVNDAPALKSADIGISMGITGTDVAKEAADMILLDDNFASIVNAIEEGRAVFQNIRKFLTYILTSNVPELVPYVVFFFFKTPLALTIVQLLAVDLGTDIFPALALGAEKPSAGIMLRPPRARHERLVTWRLVGRAYFYLGAIEAAASMAVFLRTLHSGSYLQATTACFSTIVLCQVANVFICKEPSHTVFSRRALNNRLIFGGIAVELALLLLIDYTGIGHLVFGTASLPLRSWLFMIPFAVVMLLLEEGRKAARDAMRGTLPASPMSHDAELERPGERARDARLRKSARLAQRIRSYRKNRVHGRTRSPRA